MSLPRGRIKDSPEDFLVEEIPAYVPSGHGGHLFVRFTKTNRTTMEVVHDIAHALGVDDRDVGVAGLKDKVAITTQTVSIPVAEAIDATELLSKVTLPGVVVHEAKRHGNKLRTGHLAGNRFRIVVRGIEAASAGEVVRALEEAGRHGIPNAFGPQRFGRDNAARARAWLSGNAKAPRDPRTRRLLWSTLQSEMFNAVLARRVEEKSWRTPLLGDLLKKSDTGGLFECADEAVDQARAERGEVSPTGPMFGVKMRTPSGRPAELERAVLVESLGETFDLASVRKLGEGTRRDLVLRIQDMRVTLHHPVNRAHDESTEGRDSAEQDGSLVVSFVLPKGSYATSVLGTALALDSLLRGAGTHHDETSEED